MLKVKVEDNNALRFILQDEIYLLDEDKAQYTAPTTATLTIEMPVLGFNYLGLNKKNLLILTSYQNDEFMQGDHLTALESVLTARGLNRDDVAIVNLAKQFEKGYTALITYFDSKTVIILGKDALPDAFEPTRFNAVEEIGGVKLLHTFAFEEMMNNTVNKKAFWEQVKIL